MSGFQKFKERAAEPVVDHSRCSAHDCPLKASVSVANGPWNCRYHAFAEGSEWAKVTRGLRDHDWLLGFMADLGKLERRKDWREYATQFWCESEPAMVPDAREGLELYAYRVHLSLAYRVGARSKPPTAMLPQGNAKGGGNLRASLMAVGA
jgi:hypothetical protein